MADRKEIEQSGYRLPNSWYEQDQKAGAAPSENKAAEPDATDAARELAEEEGVDLASVKGTGADGRITVSDVKAAADKG